MVAARPLERWPAAMWSDEMSADRKVPHLRIHQARQADIRAVLLVVTQVRADRATRNPDRLRDISAVDIPVRAALPGREDIRGPVEQRAACRMRCW
jgi:hypothetical protein